MNEIEAAWFAGFFEGEGTIHLSSRSSHITRAGRRNYAAPAICVTQVNREPLDKLFRIVPGSKIYGPYKYAANQQSHYKWTMQGRKNVEVMFERLKPHLSTKRIKQFEEVLSEHSSLYLSRPKLKTGPLPKERSS